MKGLRNCPICGAKAVVLRNEPDGFLWDIVLAVRDTG
jgi:hypothetical protein